VSQLARLQFVRLHVALEHLYTIADLLVAQFPQLLSR
jgi:hypothetical protein